MSQPEELHYPYKPKLLRMLCVLLFAIGLMGVMVAMAMTNAQGLVIDAVIHLDVAQATIFYWVLSSLMAIGIILVARVVVQWSQVAAPTLTLTADAVLLPKSDGSITTIFYRDIHGLSLQHIHQQHFLTIRYADRKASINHRFLPDRAAFDAVYAAITQRSRH